VPLKPSDNKCIYGFAFAYPVADANVVQSAKPAHDGLRSRHFASISVKRSA
jgi:hypothetical protein